MWTVRAEPVESPDAAALVRAYFTEIVERYWKRSATPEEIDATLAEFPSTGLATFLVLRAGGEPAGCLGITLDGELTRMYVAPHHRRGGGGRALLRAAEHAARDLGMHRLRLDTRHDLVEARALYTSEGYDEVEPFNHGPYRDHWFEKRLQGET